MRLPGITSRAVDVPHVVGAVSARIIHETPTHVTIHYKVPTGGSVGSIYGDGLGELSGFFKDVWKTIRKVVPYAAPIAGAIIPQVFPTSPWYVKAIPTATAFLAPPEKLAQTVGLTAGATLASEGIRRYLAPTPVAPDITGTLPPVGTVINGPGTATSNVAVQMPSGAIQTVSQTRLQDLLKIGGTLLGTIGGAGAAGMPPPPPGLPEGGMYPGGVIMDPWGYPPPPPPPGYSQPGPGVYVDPYTLEPYYGPHVPPPAIPPGGIFPPPAPTTEFLPAPGVRPRPGAPPAGGLSLTTLAMIGIPLVAVALMARG